LRGHQLVSEAEGGNCGTILSKEDLKDLLIYIKTKIVLRTSSNYCEDFSLYPDKETG
jgi:hypothetical protein